MKTIVIGYRIRREDGEEQKLLAAFLLFHNPGQEVRLVRETSGRLVIEFFGDRYYADNLFVLIDWKGFWWEEITKPAPHPLAE